MKIKISKLQDDGCGGGGGGGGGGAGVGKKELTC